MRATLEFDLPEDGDDHRRAVQATDMWLALHDFAEYLRGQEKHADPPDDIHAIRQEFYACLEHRDVRLD